MHCPLQFKFKDTLWSSHKHCFSPFTTFSQVGARVSCEHKQKCGCELKTLISNQYGKFRGPAKYTPLVQACEAVSLACLCHTLNSWNTNSTGARCLQAWHGYVHTMLYALCFQGAVMLFTASLRRFLYPCSLGSHSIDWLRAPWLWGAIVAHIVLDALFVCYDPLWLLQRCTLQFTCWRK